MHCAGLLFEPFGEVPAQRLIVELQHEPCQQDVAEEQQQGHRPCLREGELVLPYPSIEEVHERVVHHIERVGDISQELAGAGGRLVGRHSRSTYPYQHREEHDGAERVVEASNSANITIVSDTVDPSHISLPAMRKVIVPSRAPMITIGCRRISRRRKKSFIVIPSPHRLS